MIDLIVRHRDTLLVAVCCVAIFALIVQVGT